jgi:hypothetical protein
VETIDPLAPIVVADETATLNDVAKMIAGEVEGQTNLVAGDLEWHIDDEAEVEGNHIKLSATVVPVDLRGARVMITLRVESVVVE